ncbi:MAG: murein biosynthesis integral membrane protein MurJ [Verrucomicrobiales bacterium]|nr:murein biosynthesis integral membrane protein MurJ [Verrucomicrobiales bacterium]
MFRSMFTVGGFTLMSRILGFVRDKLIANYLGAGQLGDVWVAAFALPNMFRRIFGEGAFNSAFVPVYCRKIEEEGDEAANKFASRTITIMFWILVTIFVLAFIFMKEVVILTNWGFRADERLGLAVSAARITIVYMIFVCLMAAFSGVLNSRKRFGPPAFAYVVLNIVLIAVLLFASSYFENPLTAISYGVILAGVLQFGLVWIATLRSGNKITLTKLVIDKDIKKLSILMVPGLISAGIQQLNLLVGGTIASMDLGGRSSIYYSDRINQLPLGIIGMAAGVVLLPEISRNLRSGKFDEAKKSLAFGADASILLCIPAMVAMLVIPREIMHAIFEGGAFTGEDAVSAAGVLGAFAIGMPAYVLARVYQPGYYAREDTKTPMKFAVTTAIVNMILVYPMFLWLGVTGCALATSIAGWFNVVLLWVGLRKDDFVAMTGARIWRYSRMFLSAFGMGAAIWYMAKYGEPWLLREGGFVIRMCALTLLVFAGIIVYFVLIFMTRVFAVSDLKKMFRRG